MEKLLEAITPDLSTNLIQPVAHMGFCRDYNIEAVKELIPKYVEFLNGELSECNRREIWYAEQVLIELLKIAYVNEIPLATKLTLERSN